MKISNGMRFPHPVLAPFINDYKNSEFSSDISVKENLELSTIELTVETTITDPTLLELIGSGSAAAGIFITGLETYFNEARRTKVGTEIISFPAGALKGRIVIRPLIWTQAAVAGWRSEDFHPEFGETTFDVKKGALLAVGDESIFYVGREKLAPIESIFELRKTDTYHQAKFALDLDGDKITILVDPHTHEAVSILRGNDAGKALLMNAVYLPAVMEVLAAISGNETGLSIHRWFSPFMAKCNYLKIQMDAPSLLEDSQRLLEYPAAVLATVSEKLNS